MLQSGLADADDDADFDIKLSSLEEIWEEILPGFYDRFYLHHRDLFLQCLMSSARDELGIEVRFYTNGLELKHKLQKKRLKDLDVAKEVSSVSKALLAWVNQTYYAEAH